MHTMRLVFSLLVVSFTVSSVHALEWVEYEGTIPENAVSVNEGTEDRPVCRKNSRIGIVNDAGKCYSVKVGGGVSKKTEDDGYQILVDNSETEIELAVAAATEGTYSQTEYDAVVAAATEGMYTQTDIDAAVAEATEDMYTQAEYDAATGSDGAVYTQEEYEDLAIEAIHEGISITAAEIGLACANKVGQFSNNIEEAKYEYMEGICASGEVAASGACDN